MRLLCCDDEEPVLESYNDETKKPEYAILSHTWMAAEDEVTFIDLTDISAAKQKPGWLKVHYTCRQARKDGLSHVWIDTCCIDKTSSAELAEAINSLYRWYKRSTTCYVYLADVRTTNEDTSHQSLTADDRAKDWSRFGESLWFTRGWYVLNARSKSLDALSLGAVAGMIYRGFEQN